MKRLNRLTDITYQDEIYDKLCNPYMLRYAYSESVVVYGSYRSADQAYEPERQKEIQNIIDMYEFGASFMPDDTLIIFCKQSAENTAESTKFELVNSDGKQFTTIKGTECPICSIFVNDDIITIRKLCSLSRMGDISIWVADIVDTIAAEFNYDIIDKDTDIVTLLPQKEKSSTKK